MKKDNLFDGNFTFLDAVKIALLIVTGFSTWNVVGIMTPEGSWAWVRQLAALIVVEGAFVGFEFATANAKSRRQVRWATIGFACSLIVITLFAGLSGLLEFGGDTLMTQHASDWLGLSWSVKDVVQASSLFTLVIWIAVLASIYRIYTLNDPQKKAELDDIEIGENVTTEANQARRLANREVAPVVASHRALADIRGRYNGEMSVEQMKQMLEDVSSTLQKNYSVRPSLPEDVAVDPKRGFVPRVPPMQKEVLGILQAGARKVAAQVGLKPRTVPSPVAATAAAPLEEPHYHPTKLQPMVSSVANPIYDTSRSPIVFTPVIGIGNDLETSMILRATPCINNEWAITKDGDSKVLYLLSDYDLDYVMTGSHEEKPFVVSPAEVKPAAGGDFRTPQ